MFVLVHKFDFHIMLYLVEFDFEMLQQFVHFPMFQATQGKKACNYRHFYSRKSIHTAGIYRIIKL
jgi:hypothetical protein